MRKHGHKGWNVWYYKQLHETEANTYSLISFLLFEGLEKSKLKFQFLIMFHNFVIIQNTSYQYSTEKGGKSFSKIKFT